MVDPAILVRESIDEIKKNGFQSFFRKAKKFLFYNIYMKFRAVLPPNMSDEQIRNGVRVRDKDAKLLDTIIGFPYYENNEIEFITKYVKPGDTVVDVGGGAGVTATWCAKSAGEDGKIHVFEASSTQIQQIETTLNLNPVDSTVKLNHAVVGEIKGHVRCNEGEEAERVPARNLPECDVLNMDCEGAEMEILRDMTIRPRTILVETHAQFNSPGKKIIGILEELGYNIVEVRGNIDGMSQIAATQ